MRGPDGFMWGTGASSTQCEGAAGVVPWVCLHHFTLPRWFAAKGGFAVDANRTEHWARHVDFVANSSAISWGAGSP